MGYSRIRCLNGSLRARWWVLDIEICTNEERSVLCEVQGYDVPGYLMSAQNTVAIGEYRSNICSSNAMYITTMGP